MRERAMISLFFLDYVHSFPQHARLTGAIKGHIATVKNLGIIITSCSYNYYKE